MEAALTTMKEKIEHAISGIAAVADSLPSYVIIHNIADLSIVYMSEKGAQNLGVSLEEIRNMGTEFHTTFFNPDETEDYVPKIIGLLERNTDEMISFFQQVRRLGQTEWQWYLTSMKIFLRDDEGKPVLTIGIATPIDIDHHITLKATRLLEENNFLRNNYHRFAQLTKREREILKLLALGKSATEVAATLFISVATAETHRRNIRQKLDAATSYDLAQYARAFNLI